MRPHTRKGETGRSDPCTMYRQVHSGHKDKDEPWIDRYRPYSKVDLAVHKKKVEEVENWLKLHTEPSQGGLLLLRGPSGCGKTATINVLSRELGFRIQEWINPPNLVWCSQQVLDRTTVLSSTSQSAQFQEFLLRSNKYNCLKMVGDTSSTGRSLILVEEFPNQFYRNPSGLHDILRKVQYSAGPFKSGKSPFRKGKVQAQVETVAQESFFPENSWRSLTSVTSGVAPECVKTSESAFGLGLPSHLSLHHRESLLVDPERVIERSYVSGEFFNLYLHQNYLDFFSEMEDVHKASEYMSDADLLTSDWMSGNTLDKYASAVATRGLLHTNSQQVAVGFRPLHKPNWLLVNKKHREKCLAAQCLFRHLCMTPVSLQTELLPFLAKFTNRLSNQDEITFIQDVGHMPMKRFPVRLKLEALTDQEVHLKIDSLEDIKDVQKGSVECLSANHPQYPTTSVTENEKTMMIEEYNSD
ncbi:cell cycle checkpoint protein RAD17 isoform X11 [Syngnathus scovelli]|uniref:cell cycle checkpoint protein RAD17 isoform X11 n=1 Tax=Syngnathus scovelli TaxID=161590 RepID=UPI0035CAA0DC